MDDGLRQALERILFCSVTERSWLQASLPLPALRFDLISVPLFALPLLPFLPLLQLRPSYIIYLISTELQLGPLISSMSIICDHLKHLLPSWTLSDSSQHSLQAFTLHDHAHLKLTPYILVSSLIPSCKLFLIQTWVLVFALSDIGRTFPFYSSHLCSCGSTLGENFWAMVRALSIFITVMLLPVSCLNPSSTTIKSENFAHLPMTTW